MNQTSIHSRTSQAKRFQSNLLNRLWRQRNFVLPGTIIFVLCIVQTLQITGIPLTDYAGRKEIHRQEAFRTLSLIADLKKTRLTRVFKEFRNNTREIAGNQCIVPHLKRILTVVRTHSSPGDSQTATWRSIQTEPSYQIIAEMFCNIRKIYERYDCIQIADLSSGRFVFSTEPSDLGRMVSHKAFFQKPLQLNGIYINNIEYATFGDMAVCHISCPIRDQKGKMFAVLIMVLNVEKEIRPILHTGDGLGKTGEALLVNQEVKILTTLKQPLANGTDAKVLKTKIKAVPAVLAANGHEGIIETDDYRNVKVLAAYRHIRLSQDWGWGMVVKRDRDKLFAPIEKDILHTIVFAFVTILIIIILSMFLSQAESDIRELRNFLSNIINSMPSVLIGVDRNGIITHWNAAAKLSTGKRPEHAIGKRLDKTITRFSSEMGEIEKAILKRKVISKSKQPRTIDKKTHYEDINIYPLIANGVEGAVIRIDDVTDKVRMEEMMVQNEKMLSVGGLAAGMAHEINNPLAGMMQTANVIASRLYENPDMPANLNAAEAAGTSMEAITQFMEARNIPRMITTINESGRRVADIVNNMLSFARKSEAAISSHNMEDILDRTLELAATDYDLKKHYDFKMIGIKKKYENNLPIVPCEEIKIQQVLLNILRNGSQAMHEAGTENPQFIVRTRFEKELRMVRIEIEDNGPGMDEETRKRIFEPFFTTKPVGEGTGLGLSVSYFIITESHNGDMIVESQPGSGAKLIIRLPLES